MARQDILNRARNPVRVSFTATKNGVAGPHVYVVPPGGQLCDVIVAQLQAMEIENPSADLVINSPHFAELTTGPHRVLTARPNRT